MAIVPQRRTSKTRKRQRRSHFKLDLPGMMVCPNCGEMKLSHVVCKKCGFYDGKLVKEIKVKTDEDSLETNDTQVDEKAAAKAEAKAAKLAKKSEKQTASKEVVKDQPVVEKPAKRTRTTNK